MTTTTDVQWWQDLTRHFRSGKLIKIFSPGTTNIIELMLYMNNHLMVSYHYNNTTGAASGAGTATLPEHPCSSLVFSGDRVTRSLVLCVMYCRSLFVCPFLPFLLAIVLCVLRFTDSADPFGIFKLFLDMVLWEMF